MRKLLVLASLILSSTAFAGSFVFTSTDQTKEAHLIETDYQDYLQSGTMSAHLQEKVRAILSVNESLSEAEALDILIESELGK